MVRWVETKGAERAWRYRLADEALGAGRRWGGPYPLWTPADLERLRAYWAARVPLVDIAEALGRTPAAVQERKRLLGLTRKRPRDYTPEEDWRMAELLEAHTPYPAVAAALGRTEGSVRGRATLLGTPMTRANGRTVTAVSRLLGVESKTVAWWVREGWLRAVGPGTPMGKGTLRVVEEEDLTAFLEDEALWHLWEPSRITDPALRDWATAERRGLVFLTGAQAGDRLGLSHHRVNQLIHKGRLRAVRRGGAGQAVRWRSTDRPLGGNWLIRSDWLVVAPSGLSKTKGRRITDADRRLIRRWWGRVPATWLARHLGLKSDGAVHKAARAMGLAPVRRGYWKAEASLNGGAGPLGREAAAAP
jgi:hypothetical protein